MCFFFCNESVDVHASYFFPFVVVRIMDICTIGVNPPSTAFFATRINPVTVCFNIFRGFIFHLADITRLYGSIVLVLATDVIRVLDFLSGVRCITGADVAGSFCKHSETRLLPSAFLFASLFSQPCFSQTCMSSACHFPM